jgi:hypothetical protein
MKYSSIQEIITDPDLGLSDVEPTSDAVRRAIEQKLQSMQPDTATHTSPLYRQLVVARESLNELGAASSGARGAELVPIPSAVLERLIDAISKPDQKATPQEPSVSERMQANQLVAVTKASQDFRNRRALPLAGLGTLTAALWATRQAFGANLSHIGTAVWAGATVGIILIVVLVFLMTSNAQGRDEVFLRRIYDPDVQAEALRRIGMSDFFNAARGFTRSDFRMALWGTSMSRSGLANLPVGEKSSHEDPTGRPRNRILSTIDRVGALDDATQLAMSRFLEMDVLASRRELGLEVFEFKLISKGEQTED